MLALYGHPFSSYTWKAKIALYANDTPFDFRIVDDDHPQHQQVVRNAGPLGKFPVLGDGENLIFEATSIIEYLQQNHPGEAPLLAESTDIAIGMRMLDRVFDNYVMGPAGAVVEEYLRAPGSPDAARVDEAKARLVTAYRWLDGWLEWYPSGSEDISLVECAAAPALFYADWVQPIGPEFPRLARWRAHLLSLPEVARCVEEARPYRGWFPPGAPDRD
jgi:glutathione S-transferase